MATSTGGGQPRSMYSALAAAGVAEGGFGKSENDALKLAKALHRVETELGRQSRAELVKTLSRLLNEDVSASRVSQLRKTGTAYSMGLDDAALLVINRGTGAGPGRVRAVTVDLVLAQLADGSLDTSEASRLILASSEEGPEPAKPSLARVVAAMDSFLAAEGQDGHEERLSALLSLVIDRMAAASPEP